MKKYIHREENRWKFNFWWLQAAHSFSFWEYYNPEMMWFWKLRVLNDDIIWESGGFWMHPHNNMEIVTIPLSGSLEHKDSMRNHSTIHTWEVQAMSAWTGILHSEFNPSDTEKTQLFQIWIETKVLNISPQYNQKKFTESDRKNNIQTIVWPIQSENTVFINQDAYFSRANLDKWTSLEYTRKINTNGIYIISIEGEIEIENEILWSRDAIWLDAVDRVTIKWISDMSDILIIEVPMN
jgi:redox-sensitive bicupin YhaK (pirin superfamily)